MANPWILGIDLGKEANHTAFVGLEQDWTSTPERGFSNHYHARFIDRLPLGTPYDAPEGVSTVLSRAKKILSSPYFRGCTVALDYTGVGTAVRDIFWRANLPCALLSVTITSGMQGNARYGEADRSYHVPKIELVSVLDMVLNQDRLDVPEQPLASVLRQEMLVFRRRVSAGGKESFTGKIGSGQNDDIALGLMIGLWVGENTPVGWDGTMGSSRAVPPAPPNTFLSEEDRQADRPAELDVPGGRKLWSAPGTEW
jgi:hypothetical protein